MSNASEKQSTEDLGPQDDDSVFDFLYHDPQRIGSFLSQMDPEGLLKGVKRTNSVSDGHADTAGGQVAGEALIVKGQASASTTLSTSTNSSGEATYDPLWTNARAFLDYLAQREMIQRDLSKATIGQFVITSGTLAVLDYVMLRAMWKLPTVQHFIKRDNGDAPELNRQGRRAGAAAKGNKVAEPSEMDLALEMMDVLPHSIQGRMATAQGEMWTTLSDSCLVTSPSDLLLKHGLALPGQWSMLGILDAYPFDSAESPQIENNGSMSDIFPAFLSLLAPITKGILGRPESSYAMTPVLIFREVNGQ